MEECYWCVNTGYDSSAWVSALSEETYVYGGAAATTVDQVTYQEVSK